VKAATLGDAEKDNVAAGDNEDTAMDEGEQ